MKQTFVIGKTRDGMDWLHCLLCGKKTYNRNDIDHRYCGRCKRFHDEEQVSE